ncbi:hypothetical protein ACFOEY_12270 [Paracandidimonas soli]|uniref:Uncharacterized protein n=1 Tax=Paracandidimonas soli TaxID=1917182 RepID=A0A4R3VD32_9BURK|nr:hypothetical protein EV686_102211 [Paracandidimonas soli]
MRDLDIRRKFVSRTDANLPSIEADIGSLRPPITYSQFKRMENRTAAPPPSGNALQTSNIPAFGAP